MSRTEIEAAIKTLPKEELSRFNEWYQEFLEEQWDEQIRRDAENGKLDFLLAQVDKAEKENTLRPFPQPHFARRSFGSFITLFLRKFAR